MPRGISIHVGLNEVDPSAFNAAPLKGCINDAIAMRDIAKSGGFETGLFLCKEATFEKVDSAIRKAAEELKAGDIFLFTFAGHGSQEGDEDADEPGPEFKDETILLYDFMLIDDYLRRVLWPLFKTGVRILGVSDSCHSETLFRSALTDPINVHAEDAHALLHTAKMAPIMDEPVVAATGEATAGMRSISAAAMEEHFALPKSNSFYKDLRTVIPASEDAPLIEASVLLLAACGDIEKAADGDPHGMFTDALIKVWDNGNFSGTYEDFIVAIAARIPPGLQQNPQLTPVDPPPLFLAQRPFTI